MTSIFHHHLFLKRRFLPLSARVRHLPRNEDSSHIPELSPFVLQTMSSFTHSLHVSLPLTTHFSPATSTFLQADTQSYAHLIYNWQHWSIFRTISLQAFVCWTGTWRTLSRRSRSALTPSTSTYTVLLGVRTTMARPLMGPDLWLARPSTRASLM